MKKNTEANLQSLLNFFRKRIEGSKDFSNEDLKYATNFLTKIIEEERVVEEESKKEKVEEKVEIIKDDEKIFGTDLDSLRERFKMPPIVPNKELPKTEVLKKKQKFDLKNLTAWFRAQHWTLKFGIIIFGSWIVINLWFNLFGDIPETGMWKQLTINLRSK